MAKKVVIVGGGFGGAIAAKALENDAEVTLIDSKEYFEVKWAVLRALVEPSLSEKIIIPHSSYLQKAKVVVGTATAVSDKEVTVGEGQVYPYDYLVVASGSTPEPPLTKEEKISQIQAENAKIRGAKNILIVGGGPVGVELAGEIVTDFPDKKVTIVNNGPRLLSFIGEKAAAKAKKWLESKGVTLIMEDKIDVSTDQWGSSGTFKTEKGIELETDYLVVGTGSKANASWLQETFGSAVEKSNLKVDDTLKVEGQDKVFAVGDVALLTPKQGYLAIQQAGIAAANIKTLIQAEETGKPAKALKKYPVPPNMAIVSLGRKNGVAQLPFGTFTGFLPTMIKSKDLFVSKIRKDLKLPA